MLDFNWKSTVADVMRERIYDKVTVTSWDEKLLYDGDAFGLTDRVLLSRPVAELTNGYDKGGYDCAVIRLCQCAWQIENLPSYDELEQRVFELEGQLVMARNEAERMAEYYEDEVDNYCHLIDSHQTALHLLKFALLKQASGKKVKLRKIAKQVAFALGYDNYFDE